ncbi:ECF transporter S component [Amphibacillus indicireducens]|uniref:ECF transporter S component n=1 Tax=Amphibacillus indicireducens TaxID=1076330 RepID=A0ABP7W4C8_9BACI
MNIKKFTLTAIFISIILLFAFTPVGFINLVIIKATIIHIPVIIASILLGPRIGALQGLVFGLTSVIINTLSPSLLSFAFSPFVDLVDVGPARFWALFIAIVPRVLLGIIPFYLYQATKRIFEKTKFRQKPALFLTGLLSTFIHTFLVMGSIAFFFQDAYAQAIDVNSVGAIFNAILTVFLTNGLAEAIVAAVITTALVPPLLKIVNR